MPSPGLRVLYYVLLAAVLILGVILAAGTVVGLVRGRGARPLLTLGESAAAGNSSAAVSGAAGEAGEADEAVYSGLGRLRIPAGNATVVLSVTFPYFPGDTAFTEELAARTPVLREITAGYFSSLAPGRLENPDEETIKVELLDRFNETLRLGKIRILYFSDFLVLE
jgi:flagellar basal body-associated protein FliL